MIHARNLNAYVFFMQIAAIVTVVYPRILQTGYSTQATIFGSICLKLAKFDSFMHKKDLRDQ